MRHRNPKERRCTYVVPIEKDAAGDEIRELGSYLSTIALADCDVLVLDASPRQIFLENGRSLRWIGRHVAVSRHSIEHERLALIRAAVERSLCEKVIIASEDIRYTATELDRLCDLLDVHEVVEPEEYVDPLPWWGTIEAGRLLVQRGVDVVTGRARTFGLRRTAVGGLKALDPRSDEHDVRQLASQGAEVFGTPDVFVRRRPPLFLEWLQERPKDADRDFVLPFKSAFFFGLIPIALLLAAGSGLLVAAGYTSAVALLTVLLAVRGRAGAATFFPLRACLYAPLWVFERSVSVYWALFRRIRAVAGSRGSLYLTSTTDQAEGRQRADRLSGLLRPR